MTHEQREQAAEVLEKFQKGIYGYGGKVGVAIDTAIAALRGPHPDPITGLVPCGCGGVARVAVQYAYPDERRVFCERCGLTTIWLSAPMSVLQFHWNRAMGMLEVEG
jgi:hypothetical protein